MSMVLLLTWCGKSSTTEDVIVSPFVVQIDENYLIQSSSTSDTKVYRAGTGDSDSSLIQFALSRVDTGVTMDQMTQLNLQKLAASIPWYDYIFRTDWLITCDQQDYPGQQVSFITNQWDEQLYHSQYYTLIQSQWYMWSVTSTTDNATDILTDLIDKASCLGATNNS